MADVARRTDLPVSRPRGATADAFRSASARACSNTLDLDSWPPASTWSASTPASSARSSGRSSSRASSTRAGARLPEARLRAGAPPEAGYYDQVPVERHRDRPPRAAVQRRGGGCDGTTQDHDTLALTVHQIGVCLVSLHRATRGAGARGCSAATCARHTATRSRTMLALLERRGRRAGLNQPDRRDGLSRTGPAGGDELRRGGRAAGQVERAVWRMGHGSPAPYQLLAGAGNPDLAIESITVLRRLIEGHRKFVFVASEPGDRGVPDRRPGAAAAGVRDRRHAGRADRATFVEDIHFAGQPTVDDAVGRRAAAAGGVGDAVPRRGGVAGAGGRVPGVAAGPAAGVLRPPRPLRAWPPRSRWPTACCCRTAGSRC